MPIYQNDLNSTVVDALIAVVQSQSLTIMEAAEAFDAAKAKLGYVKIQAFASVDQDEPKNGRTHALRDLSLV